MKKIILEMFKSLIKDHPEYIGDIQKIILENQSQNFLDVSFVFDQMINNFSDHLKNISVNCRAQLKQDLFVLNELMFKRNGFFVEFGAMEGLTNSNSYLLEKSYGWSGILAEPGKNYRSDLYKNRHCIIDTRCIWKNSNEKLIFNQTLEPDYSTLDIFSDSDHHVNKRKNGEKYSVDTISLVDLLDEHRAPTEIDYLSIDTEGSEYDILENFDFQKYKIKVITCEHNYTPQRDLIKSLLEKNGFKRKYEDISQWDDWFVQEKV